LAPFARETKKHISLTHENSVLTVLENRVKELMEEERLLLQLEAKGYIDSKMFMEQDAGIIAELEVACKSSTASIIRF
jgi:hypothetical protein